MQNIDKHRAVRVGQGESIIDECSQSSSIMLHKRGDSLNVFIAKTAAQTGELYLAGANESRGRYKNRKVCVCLGGGRRVMQHLSIPPSSRLPAKSHHLSDVFSMSHFMLLLVSRLLKPTCCLTDMHSGDSAGVHAFWMCVSIYGSDLCASQATFLALDVTINKNC